MGGRGKGEVGVEGVGVFDFDLDLFSFFLLLLLWLSLFFVWGRGREMGEGFSPSDDGGAWLGWERGFDRCGRHGTSVAVEAYHVALIGTRVGGIAENEEVVFLLFEGDRVAAWED